MKKFSTMMIVHLSVVCAALVLCLVGAVLLFGAGATGYERGEGIQRAIVNIINILALASGVVYILKEYAKGASFYYNAFFCMQIAATALLIVLNSVFFVGGAVAVLSLVALGIRAIAMILLIFLSDLGRKKAFIIFYVILAMDILGIILLFVSGGATGVGYRVVEGLSRLLIAAAIGLTIWGKYSDKAKRHRDVN